MKDSSCSINIATRSGGKRPITPSTAWRDAVGTAETRGEVLKLLLKLGLFSKYHNRLSCSLSTFGTGGGTRTRTRIAPQRILSPLRLPFRHTGIASPSESSASSGPARNGTVQNHTSPSGRKKTKTSLNHSSRLEWMGSANLLSVCDR